MTDLTADEMHDRILRSLKANSAEFEQKRRAKRNRRIQYYVLSGLIFVVGLALGVLLMTSRLFAQIADSLLRFVGQ